MLKKDFSYSFKSSDKLILCPVYAAGEKVDKSYKDENFAKQISKNSDTQVILIYNQNELNKFLKRNLFNDELIIGMGAGSITKWMSEISLK